MDVVDGTCPCGSAQAYAKCCGPFLSGQGHPATAVALMRSRYTAYARRDAAYLLKTWHPDTRPAALDFSGDGTEWAGLAILRREAGGPEDAQGTVEFAAAYRQGGKLRQMRENSRFVKESGEWLYLDGDILPETKPGRNDALFKPGRNDALFKPGRNGPCPCGSGKKYKKCCG